MAAPQPAGSNLLIDSAFQGCTASRWARGSPTPESFGPEPTEGDLMSPPPARTTRCSAKTRAPASVHVHFPRIGYVLSKAEAAEQPKAAAPARVLPVRHGHRGLRARLERTALVGVQLPEHSDGQGTRAVHAQAPRSPRARPGFAADAVAASAPSWKASDDLRDLPLDMTADPGLPPARDEVTRAIPPSIRTYGEIAREIGDRGARAVGQALGEPVRAGGAATGCWRRAKEFGGFSRGRRRGHQACACCR